VPIVPIIGGGPAGMSCALWLHNYGFNPVIIEREGALGGMARLTPYPNAWLLGQRGKSGRENALEFAAHMRELAVETWLGSACGASTTSDFGSTCQARRRRDHCRGQPS
jgi:thioredoxin reductase